MSLSLGDLPDYLERFDYPMSREEATVECEDVTVELADGRIDLGRLLSGAPSQRYESADDLHTAIENELPREAVGEPFQSEGEG